MTSSPPKPHIAEFTFMFGVPVGGAYDDSDINKLDFY